MTPEQFCYWLQGFTELNANAAPTWEQWASIREHLALVFDKRTPKPAEVKPKVDPDVDKLRKAAEEAQRATPYRWPEGPRDPFDPFGPKVIC